MINYQNHKSREEEIREQLSLDEAIKIIKTKYQFAEYDPDRPNFDAWDQLLTCEAVTESTPIKYKYKEEEKVNLSVSGMNNDSSKQTVNFELSEGKLQVISELKKFTSLTLPNQVAKKLEELFKEWKSKSGHWLYIAQNWNPREINRTIKRLKDIHTSGRRSIQNPAAYFTFLIKFRKKRKRL